MAGERTLPGIGLYGFWAAGSNGWKDQNDENLRKLSVLTQAAVISRTTAIPAAPANGSVYLVPANAGANANSFAIRDNGAFVYLPPAEGMLVYVRDTDIYVTFDGAAWNPLKTGFDDAPVDGKLYARKNGGWAEVKAGLIRGGANAPSTRWRIMFNGAQSDPNIALLEIAFLASATGPVLSVDGTPTSSGMAAGVVASLFDGLLNQNIWIAGKVGVWVEYQTPAPVSVNAVKLWSQIPQISAWPTNITVQRWDGAAWVDEWTTPTGLTGNNQIVTLQDPAYGVVEELVFPWPDETTVGKVMSNDGDGLIWIDPPEGGGGGGDGIEEAPADGKLYGRQNSAWTEVPTGDGTGLPEAPADGTGYVRKDNAWVPEETGGGGGEGGIEEAPEDGTPYVRQDAGWVPAPEGGGEGAAAPFRGALIKPSTDQAYSAGNASVIRFATETYDIGGFYDPVAPNEVTIPAGVSKIRLSAQIGFTVSPHDANQFSFSKNGSRDFAGCAWGFASSETGAYANPAVAFTTGVIEVVPGDKFGLIAYSGGAFTLESEATWLAVEVVESVSTSARLRDLIDTAIPTEPEPGDSLVWDDVAKKWKPGVPVVAANVAQGVNKPFRGAMVAFTASKALGTPMVPILWDTADYDTDALWSAGSPGRFTIPAGVKKVRLSAALAPDGTVLSGSNTLQFRKNGAVFRGGQGTSAATGWADGAFQADTPVIPVVAGDYFEVRWSTSDTGTNPFTVNSYFAIEIVEVETVL